MSEYKDNSETDQQEDLFEKFDNIDNLFDNFEKENDDNRKNIENKLEREQQTASGNTGKNSTVKSVLKRITGVFLLVIGILFMLVSIDMTSDYVSLSKKGNPIDAQIIKEVSRADNEYIYLVEYSVGNKKHEAICSCSIEYEPKEYIRAFEIKDELGAELIECDNVDVGAYLGALITILGIILSFNSFWVKLIAVLVLGVYSTGVSIAFSQNDISALSFLSFGTVLIWLIIKRCKTHS